MGKKSRTERTIFDYVKGLARMRKQTPEEVENRVKKLPAGEDEFRDILTAIHFLRQNADTLNAPMQTTVYSDGKEYPVIFKPGARRTFVIEGKQTPARGFEIVDAPGGKKWPGGVTVWLTSDDRRIPVRIEIQQSLAALQLDLQKIESCATLWRGSMTRRPSGGALSTGRDDACGAGDRRPQSAEEPDHVQQLGDVERLLQHHGGLEVFVGRIELVAADDDHRRLVPLACGTSAATGGRPCAASRGRG